MMRAHTRITCKNQSKVVDFLGSTVLDIRVIQNWLGFGGKLACAL